jgi:hypothetical protein
MYIEIILHSHFTSTQSTSRYGNVRWNCFFDLFICLSLFLVNSFFLKMFGIMFVAVVLPSNVVNWTILICSVAKKQMLQCVIYHNSINWMSGCCAFNFGMLMCKSLEVLPTQPKSLNATCNKSQKHVWPYILKTSMKNLQSKHILIINGLTTLLTIGLPSNVSFARFAWKIITLFLIT